jgi:hypothetical protein
MLRSFALAALCVAAFNSVAQAQRPAAPPPETVRDWYGLEIIALDVAATAMMVSGVSIDSDGLFAAGALTAWIGPAIVHGRNDNTHAAVRAALLRPLVPLTSLAVAMGMTCSGGYCGGGDNVAIAAGASYAIIAVLDAASASRTRRVRPDLAVASDGAVRFGVSGAF